MAPGKMPQSPSDAEPEGIVNTSVRDSTAESHLPASAAALDSPAWAAVPVPTYSVVSYFYTRFRTILGLRYVDIWEAMTLVVIFLTLGWFVAHISVEVCQIWQAMWDMMIKRVSSSVPV